MEHRFRARLGPTEYSPVVPIMNRYGYLVAYAADNNVVRVLQVGGIQVLSCTRPGHTECHHVEAVKKYERQHGLLESAVDEIGSDDDVDTENDEDDNIDGNDNVPQQRRSHYLALIEGIYCHNSPDACIEYLFPAYSFICRPFFFAHRACMAHANSGGNSIRRIDKEGERSLLGTYSCQLIQSCVRVY